MTKARKKAKRLATTIASTIDRGRITSPPEEIGSNNSDSTV